MRRLGVRVVQAALLLFVVILAIPLILGSGGSHDANKKQSSHPGTRKAKRHRPGNHHKTVSIGVHKPIGQVIVPAKNGWRGVSS